MFFKDFTNHRRNTKKTLDFTPKFLSTRTTDETFQQAGKKDFLRHRLKSATNVYESSGSQFFKTTPGIQSGPDAFDKSRLVMTFLTNMGVREIRCSFRLVIEGKIGKDIPASSRLEFLEMFFVNSFALSDA